MLLEEAPPCGNTPLRQVERIFAPGASLTRPVNLDPDAMRPGGNSTNLRSNRISALFRSGVVFNCLGYSISQAKIGIGIHKRKRSLLPSILLYPVGQFTARREKVLNHPTDNLITHSCGVSPINILKILDDILPLLRPWPLWIVANIYCDVRKMDVSRGDHRKGYGVPSRSSTPRTGSRSRNVS